MPDNIGEALICRARTWGATNLRIEQGGKHPRLVGDYKGVAFMFVFPGSTGDRRAVLNCLSDLRRVLRVERQEKPERSPTPRRLRRRALMPRRVSPLIAASPREDKYYAPLARLRAALSAEASREVEGPREEAVVLRTPFLGRRKRFLEP